MLVKLWRRSPWDGSGWGKGDDADFTALRTWAASRFRRRVALPLRPPLLAADRVIWLAAAAAKTWAFAQRHGLSPASAAHVFADSLLSGADPVEAYIWRRLHGSRHPLPARAVTLLLPRLGDPAGHALLADKLAAAEILTAAGAILPTLRGVVSRGTLPDRDLFDASTGTGLFVKPRHGSGGRGAFGVHPGNNDWPNLERRLKNLAASDDLLVQERLTAHCDLADLTDAGLPPVLRVTTVQMPDGVPFVHSALLEVPVPGRNPGHFLFGQVRAPVDIAAGTLTPGLLLGKPTERLAAVPWNQAVLSGREIPAFAEAKTMALRAMAAVPPLPLVNWDIVPTGSGPVLLEGNTGGNWILTTLAGRYGLDAGPLAPLLTRWLPP